MILSKYLEWMCETAKNAKANYRGSQGLKGVAKSLLVQMAYQAKKKSA